MEGGHGLFLSASRNTSNTSRRRLVASRIILGLTLVLLLVMPLTEQMWAGDDVLRGGHDAELSSLGELAFCGLVALTADQVVASPLLELLLAHRTTRTPLRQLLRGVSVLAPVNFRCRPRVQRSIDLSVPLSLMSLRI